MSHFPLDNLVNITTFNAHHFYRATTSPQCLLPRADANPALLKVPLQDGHRNEMQFQALPLILPLPNCKMRQLRRKDELLHYHHR
jgi:hypothetical protein